MQRREEFQRQRKNVYSIVGSPDYMYVYISEFYKNFLTQNQGPTKFWLKRVMISLLIGGH